MKSGLFLEILLIVFCSSTLADEIYGLEAMQRLDRLPYLSSGISAGQQSSYDRTGGNGDAGNYLYTEPDGEHVMLDVKGPGTVYCIWTTGLGGNDVMKAYIDGEAQPRLNMTLANLFGGTNAPFLTPLSGNSSVSSGGFYSYVPLPFASSMKITINSSGFYHVGYHTFTPDTKIISWSPDSNVDAIQKIWQSAGSDPKEESSTTAVCDTFNLGAGQTRTLLDVNGPGEVVSIRMHIPALGDLGGNSTNYQGSFTDDGRAFTGYSQFTIAIDPANQGIRLKRRLDYIVANQAGSVSVDGMTVGNWSSTGSDNTCRWKESSFIIPSSFTAGKSSATIKISFVNSSSEWNEFYYWAYSELAGGMETISDSLDIGKTSSESAHRYTINNQSWSGSQTFYCSRPEGSYSLADTLNAVNLKIFWDNETVASVDAPIGSFFAMGHFGSYPTKSLMLGIDGSGYLYCFFPMPFAHHALIQLSSTSTAALTGVISRVSYSPFCDPFAQVGYFKTRFNHSVHTGGDHADVVFLDTAGSGKFLGVVESMSGGTDRLYLEGDERFYVDNNRSPAFQGTGTEDFYNAGWYFQNGPFSLPMQGNTAHVIDNSDLTAAYRFFFQDAVDFRTHIWASKEHGDPNVANEEDWTLAYYYLNPQPTVVLCDSVDVGKSSSETAHSFFTDSLTWSGNLNSTFEGIHNDVSITDSGKSSRGNCGFTVAILPSNNGVILRRMFDQNDPIQQAEVFVDGSPAGTWYHAGSNGVHEWREDEFMVPSSFTYGKSRLSVVLSHAPGTPDWSAFKYTVFSLTDTSSAASLLQRVPGHASAMPVNAAERYAISIFAINGRLMKRMEFGNGERFLNFNRPLMKSFPAGAYIYTIQPVNESLIIRRGKLMVWDHDIHD